MQRLRWKRPTWFKPAITVLGIGAIGAAVVSVAIVVPWWQTAALRRGVTDYQKGSPKLTDKELAALQTLAALEKAQLDTENALRTSLIQGLGGTVLLVGLFFTYRNLKVAEDKLVTDRFSKAVEMFSNKDLHTRLGGLYALERIANDSDRDYPQVMEVLCAFVRAESPYPPKPQDATAEGTAAERAPATAVAPDLVEAPEPAGESEASQSTKPSPGSPEWWEQRRQEQKALFAALAPLRTDIQAVMTVIGRRKHRYGEGEWETQRLDLRQTDLRLLQAAKANLTGVNLSGAHLEHANLSEAQLEGADLFAACLEGADLSEAQLEGALLFATCLEGADLSGVYLEGKDLSYTDLEGVNLSGAHLEDADMSEAHLEDARLWSTDLSQVRGLTQEQLNAADTAEDTLLPPGLYLPVNHHRYPTPDPTAPSPSTAAPEPSPTAPSTSPEPSAASTPDPSAEPLTVLTPATQTEPKAESEGTSS